MELTLKKVIITVAITLITGYAIGKYTTPTKVEIKKETVYVEKRIVDKDELKRIELERNKTLRKIIIEITKPDGTKEKTTRYVEKTSSNKTIEEKTKTTEKTETEIKTTETKLVENSRTELSLSLLAGAQIKDFSLTSTPIAYGGHLQKRILGPITLGVWGLSNLSCGFSLGLGL